MKLLKSCRFLVYFSSSRFLVSAVVRNIFKQVDSFEFLKLRKTAFDHQRISDGIETLCIYRRWRYD